MEICIIPLVGQRDWQCGSGANDDICNDFDCGFKCKEILVGWRWLYFKQVKFQKGKAEKNVQPNDASYTNHSLYTVYFILFRSYSFQLDCRLFAAVNTRQDEAFFLYFIFFFKQVMTYMCIRKEMAGDWSHTAVKYFSSFFQKRKKRRGGMRVLFVAHTDTV